MEKINFTKFGLLVKVLNSGDDISFVKLFQFVTVWYVTL